jgi:hypothetical protein
MVFWKFMNSWFIFWSDSSVLVIVFISVILESLHCLLAVKQTSVIEEKGEGFENGKSTILSAWT